MSVCCDCCVLSGRGLCDELITRPEETYRLWRVVVCDLETSWMGRPWPTGGRGGGGGCRAKNKQTNKQTKVGFAISLKVNSKICIDFNSIGYLCLRWQWRNYVTFCYVSCISNLSDPPLSSYIRHERTICHNPHNSPSWVSRFARRLGYKHTFCRSVVSTKKKECLFHYFLKNTTPKFWSIKDLPSFFMSSVKLCIGGLLLSNNTKYIGVRWSGCSHITTHRCTLIGYFDNCNFSKHE
jgi:hypothetical protein